MNKSYLPSKEFVIKVLAIILIVGGVLGISKLFQYLKNRKDNKPQAKVSVIGDLIQKDTNKNGIPDWEEYLWGLDPEKNGPENKEFILAKKKTIQESGIVLNDESLITDHEMLSRQFFAAIIALQQTGQLDETSMKSISEAVGKNIEPVSIPDMYTKDMLKIKDNSQASSDNYRVQVEKLIQKYSNADIGSEITFIIQGISSNDPQALYAAQTVATSYENFGEEFLTIEVPNYLAEKHLSAANNYAKVGQTIKDLSKSLLDPITGMKSILNYKNYSDKLSSDLESISNLLQ